MSDNAVRQANNVVPPRHGSVAALSVDATARSYDLTALTLGGNAFGQQWPEEVYLTLQADGSDVYLLFHSASASDLDNTQSVSAGGTLAFANTYAAKLPAGGAVDFRIRRNVDKFI